MLLFMKRISYFLVSLLAINKRLEKIQQTLGRLEARQIASLENCEFNDYEFQTYSQWGEDGLIQLLICEIPIKKAIFVEFGVENYTESNTRFLLTNNNWSGLVIDGSEKNIGFIKNDSIYWKYNIKAVSAFIDKDNINDLIKSNGIQGDIGLLSIDIDGNDYWVWDAIEVVDPRIVICEYNSLFGPEKNVTIPYDKSFLRTNTHYSNLYYGASITALSNLAKSKGYSLVGSNTAGNDLFFVRNDCMQNLTEVNPEQAYVKTMFRESRNMSGALSFLAFDNRLKLLSDMPVINLDDRKTYLIRDLYNF